MNYEYKIKQTQSENDFIKKKGLDSRLRCVCVCCVRVCYYAVCERNRHHPFVNHHYHTTTTSTTSS